MTNFDNIYLHTGVKEINEYFNCFKRFAWFGDRAILEDVSFRLAREGRFNLCQCEGKSTFMNIIIIKPYRWGRIVKECTCWLSWITFCIKKGMTIENVLLVLLTIYMIWNHVSPICILWLMRMKKLWNSLIWRSCWIRNSDRAWFMMIDAKVSEVARN